MRINFSEILEGWRNDLFPPEKLKELILKTSEERMRICEQCPAHSKNHKTVRKDVHCTACGCPLIKKTKCLSCECPLKKWEAITSEEEEDKILKSLENVTEE
jgi:hypothetical protein